MLEKECTYIICIVETCLSNFEVIKINVVLLTGNSCGVNHYFVSWLVFLYFSTAQGLFLIFYYKL